MTSIWPSNPATSTAATLPSPAWMSVALLPNLVKHVEGEAVNKAVQWCSDEIQRPYEPVGSDGLLQSWFGEPAELLQPRLDQRPEAFDLVGVDAVLSDVFFGMNDCPFVLVDEWRISDSEKICESSVVRV